MAAEPVQRLRPKRFGRARMGEVGGDAAFLAAAGMAHDIVRGKRRRDGFADAPAGAGDEDVELCHGRSIGGDGAEGKASGGDAVDEFGGGGAEAGDLVVDPDETRFELVDLGRDATRIRAAGSHGRRIRRESWRGKGVQYV